jgi:hypothetical protein
MTTTVDTAATSWTATTATSTVVLSVDDARAAVQAAINSDEAWGDLGDAYLAAGDGALAQGCYTIARIKDTADSEWVQKATAMSGAVDALRAVGVTDDEWVGDLGDLAVAHGAALANSLYTFAISLDPADEEWQRKSSQTTTM